MNELALHPGVYATGKEEEITVTFEAEDNSDFRLGTGPYRLTGAARAGDIASISRVGEVRYELRIYRQETDIFNRLLPRAMHPIGHRGEKYGFMPNREFEDAIGARIAGR